MNKPNILVVGDLMIDHYLWGSCDRISPEAPVQVINVTDETFVLGGAGNVVNNLVALDSNVTVISAIGADKSAEQLKQMLDNIDVTYELIVEDGRLTTQKSRIISANQQVVRYDKESKHKITLSTLKQILNYIQKNITKFDIVLLSDYGKGVLTTDLIQQIISISNRNNIKVLVDPKGNDYQKYMGAYLLTPNKKEATQATDIEIVDDESLIEILNIFKDRYNISIPLITLSEDGIAILQNETLLKEPTVAKEVYDVTGAGDTVLASLGYQLSLHNSISDAIRFANLAAGVVVGKLGSATATNSEIEEYKHLIHHNNIEHNIKTFSQIHDIAQNLRDENQKIVFTNGCFDILHKGHVSYLSKAKSLGDVLIVGLNSDSSVRKLKGDNRPINNQDDRAFVLLALQSVDYVVIFDEDTPYKLIETIRPDILVKGADYKDKEVVGSDIVDDVRLIDFVDGKSTTNIINRINCS